MTLGAVARIEAVLASRRAADASPSRLPFPDRPAGSDCLPQIRHIVVVMMENHSFDNYLGVLGRGDGLPTDEHGLVCATNPTSDGVPVLATHLGSTTQHVGVPTQSWEASHLQWDDGANDGFARAAEAGHPDDGPAIAMGYWTAADLPFYHGLARTFPLADRWFSSCLGPTFPNRRFLLSGTANGLTSDLLAEILDYPQNGTIFDLLTSHGISWVNYHSVSHTGPILRRVAGVHSHRVGRHLRRMIGRLRTEPGAAKRFLQFSGDAYPLGLLRYLAHLRSIDQFCTDAARGKLPAVSIVDPDFCADSEENPQDIRLGQAFAARVINAAMGGADWMGTLLVWCYDEGGGYYDHVPPPAAPEPDERQPEAEGPWRFDRYGFRVPAVLVSPYARPDYVSHVERDHTSVLKLIERKWNLPSMTARDAAADDLLDMVDLDAPPAFATPPDLPRATV
ncbi:MAG: alkaline phosphatase family protein [Actinomycetota bacterium]|nr:alkaline phosphatase family protein [Actinomycetota bacterium]MDQ6946111.1 alkaline phosphatase family protein [Actinomycetota bacterium]